MCQSTTWWRHSPFLQVSPASHAFLMVCMAVLFSVTLFAQLLLGWPAHPCLWADQNCWVCGVVGALEGRACIARFTLYIWQPLLNRSGSIYLWSRHRCSHCGEAQLRADSHPAYRSALHPCIPCEVHGCSLIRFFMCPAVAGLASPSMLMGWPELLGLWGGGKF